MAKGGQLLCPNSFRTAALLHTGLSGPVDYTENKLNNVSVQAIRNETDHLLSIWDEIYFQNAIQWTKNKFKTDSVKLNDICILKDRVTLKKPSGLNGALGRVVGVSEGGRNLWLRVGNGNTLRRAPEDVALLLHHETEVSEVTTHIDVLDGAADLPAIFAKKEEVAVPALVPPPVHSQDGGGEVLPQIGRASCRERV